MRRDWRSWWLAGVDLLLSEEQRQLPPRELGRYRVLVGATVLNLVLAVQLLLQGLSAPNRSFYVVAGPIVLASYLGVLALIRRTASPWLPSLLLCTLLSVGMVAVSLSMGIQQAATHAAHMLLPALAAYLLGARLGLVFTVLFGLNVLFLHPFYLVGFDLSRPLFPDEMGRSMSILAALSLLGGWMLNWIHVAAREAAHASLEQMLGALRESEGKLLSIIESTDDLVMALDTRGSLLSANQSVRTLFLRILGRDVVSGEPVFDAFPPAPRAHLSERLSLVLGGQRVRTEVSFPLGDRFQTLETTLSPVLGAGGRVVGMTVFGRDITERKEREARLSEMHRGLLEASRLAGMAELATGVLHNVGNALNSVSVSAGVVVEKVRGSRIAGLSRAVEMLRERASRPGAPSAEDSQGDQLLEYLQSLSEQFSQEREAVLEEMRRLGQSVEHIRAVVGMQQKNARASAVMEKVAVPELIDDALRLHAVSFERLGIQLRREYAQIPPVLVDRHKLLQILVNLLGNARQALTAGERPDKQLELRVEVAGERLRIAVADNGVGIAPENLPRIFTRGFTTKKNGHGFGLHISALTAEEMGGRLTCESRGPGQGATFTLDLPRGPV